MRDFFSDRSRIQAWLDILSALAVAQAELGIIPSNAADEISTQSKVEALDFDLIVAETRATSHSLLGLIRAVQRILSTEAGEWFCFGATVQDVSDTWTVLALRHAGTIAFRDLRSIELSLVELARQNRGTVAAARTHGQPGVPIPFGFKFAVWAAEIRRHIERLKEGKGRWLVGQLGGAAGTGSFWGDQAAELQMRFCRRLELSVPDAPWLTARDRLTEFAGLAAMVTHTLAKIGNEIVQLQRPEVGEASEPFATGEVGSITMPHKRNPERAEHLVTLARLARADLGVLMESMIVEHERDGRAWKSEWAAFPDLCLLTGASLAIGRELLAGLNVDPKAMLRNVEAQKGYILSERVMRALAQQIGKQTAHQAIYEASMEGWRRGLSFRDALENSPLISSQLRPADLEDLLNLKTSLAEGTALVDRILENVLAARSLDPVSWP
jgi:adenylosuccinate lyase